MIDQTALIDAAIAAARTALPDCEVDTFGWISGDGVVIVPAAQDMGDPGPVGLESHARITPAGEVEHMPYNAFFGEIRGMEKFGDWPDD